jgi:hypothetical protein
LAAVFVFAAICAFTAISVLVLGITITGVILGGTIGSILGIHVIFLDIAARL